MLIGGLTIEEMKEGYSRPRNKGIMSAFAYMKIVEHWGSGIPRLYRNCEQAGLREPELSEKAGCFRVNVFRNTELAINSSEEVQKENQGETREKNKGEKQRRNKEKTKEKIIQLMKDNPEITYRELMEKLGLSKSGVEYAVRKLRESGRIERLGADKGGKWKVYKEDTEN